MGHGGGCCENAPVPGSAETAAERAANPEVRGGGAGARDPGASARARPRSAGARDRGGGGERVGPWARARDSVRMRGTGGMVDLIFVFAWQAL